MKLSGKLTWFSIDMETRWGKFQDILLRQAPKFTCLKLICGVGIGKSDFPSDIWTTF